MLDDPRKAVLIESGHGLDAIGARADVGLLRTVGEADASYRSRLIDKLRDEDEHREREKWSARTWEIFGYKLLCNTHHRDIAAHLKAIDDALLADGPVTLTITLNAESADESPNT